MKSPYGTDGTEKRDNRDCPTVRNTGTGQAPIGGCPVSRIRFDDTGEGQEPKLSRVPCPAFYLTLKAEPNPSDPTGLRRLRRALKCLLRSFGLRCTNITERAEELELDNEPGKVSDR
jgi:hypothetical protein